MFTGDTVRAESSVTSVEDSKDQLKVTMDFTCYNQHGKEVLRGKTRGIIRKS